MGNQKGPSSFIHDHLIPKGTRLAGWAFLVDRLGVQAPLRAPSAVAESHIKGSLRSEGSWTIYDKRYWPGDGMTDHLTFALRHEAIDLLILKRSLAVIPPSELAAYVRESPTGVATRRTWFFYEWLTGRSLDIDDAPAVTAVDALDPEAYVTSEPRLSRRHRVRDNLLGTPSFCPVVRRTQAIEEMQDKDLSGTAATIVGRTGARLSARAASFLLLADSRASFEIEGERPPRNRIERWGRAIQQAGKCPLSMEGLDRLQEILIEDTRFTHAGLRQEGIFLGERGMDGEPLPEFIGARAEDFPSLLSGVIASNERMKESGVDPVIHAAAIAFGFVYIHPYEDGNGRIHRWMVHQILAQRGFTPKGMIFPVSSVMLDRVAEYRKTLQDHTGPLMRFIEWIPTVSRNVEVTNDTADLYSYFDCTNAAEFLHGCVSRTVEHDLPAEIEFLQRQDDAQRRIMDAVEMPDQVALDLILFMRQNRGRISMRRRKGRFEALTDDEVREIETIYKEVFRGDAE